MTMTDYLPIEPIGLQGGEIEAFGALFCRMARMHCVSLYSLERHLREWWTLRHPNDHRARVNVINALNPLFCGIGPNVAAYLDIVAEATGCDHLTQTTFLPLRKVLGLNAGALIRAGRAWCPACHAEDLRDLDTPYDRLLWALRVVERCHIHRIALESTCPLCGARQPRYHHLGRLDLCCRCKQSLQRQPKQWTYVEHPPLYESECIRLTEGMSCGRLVIVDDAWGIFVRELAEYVSAVGRKLPGFYYGADVTRPLIGRDTRAPQFTTLLKRCAEFGIDPVQVLTAPTAAAQSACVLEFARLKISSGTKPLRPVELLQHAKSRIAEEMAKDHAPLSVSALAKELGVTKGFLNYRLGPEVSLLAEHWRGCRRRLHDREGALALEYLLGGPAQEYPSSRFPSLDHLVAAAVNEVGIGVARARRAVEVALRQKVTNEQSASCRNLTPCG